MQILSLVPAFAQAWLSEGASLRRAWICVSKMLPSLLRPLETWGSGAEETTQPGIRRVGLSVRNIVFHVVGGNVLI